MRRFLIWTVVLVIAVAAGFGIGALTFKPPNPDLLGASSSPSERPATVSPSSPAAGASLVPNLVGMKRVAAEKQLDKLKPLYVVTALGGSSDIVKTQNPAAGTSLKETTRISIAVQCKPKPCPAPPEGRVIYDPCSCSFR